LIRKENEGTFENLLEAVGGIFAISHLAVACLGGERRGGKEKGRREGEKGRGEG
jgi:hypothetical protein